MDLRRATAVLVALPLAAAAACGGGSSGGKAGPSAPATAPADVAAAKSQITQNWETFFKTSTPPTTAVGLLQGGTSMAGALQVAQQEQATTKIQQAAKVNSIAFTSATSATVHWALLNGTTPLLPDATGMAVLDAGTWKVSKQTFCTLVQLGANGKTVPGC